MARYFDEPSRLRGLLAKWPVWLLACAIVVTSPGFWQPGAALAQSGVTSEQAVKAAFVNHFIKFVEWPAAAFASETAPLVIAVLGSDAQFASLAAMAGRTVRSRTIELRRVTKAAPPEGAQVLVLWNSDGGNIAPYLTGTSAKPLLTISDTPRFVDRGGIIGLVTVEDKVRFEVNLAVARTAQLKISAQLLQLARTVIE